MYVCLVSLMSAGSTYADAGANGWYVGGSGDVTWLEHSDTGGGGNIDIGYRIAPDIRLEGEVGYHDAAGESGHPDQHYFTYMGNAYYDFNQLAYAPASAGWRMVPYIGGGIGMASINNGNSNFANTFHHHDDEFAYQGMAGVSFICDSMPNADWVLGYRYQGADENSIEANNIELGVRFHF